MFRIFHRTKSSLSGSRNIYPIDIKILQLVVVNTSSKRLKLCSSYDLWIERRDRISTNDVFEDNSEMLFITIT